MASSQHPLIGITSSMRSKSGMRMHELKQEYTRAVQRAGGLAVILPVFDAKPAEFSALLARLDGVVLSGGGDLDPRLYTDDHFELSRGIQKQRDDFELALVQQLVKMKKPFLAICRGAQVLNVALGGNLIQDIATELPAAGKHDYFSDSFPGDKLVHQLQPKAGSLLAQIVGTGPIRVNSRHHQAIARLGAGLQVTARAEDEIIEAIELDGHPFGLGVQWHPESLKMDPAMHALFEALMAACA